MSPVEPCPVCGQNRHRAEEESEHTLCMSCRMRNVKNDHIIHGWEDEEKGTDASE
jgi:hypothetical protein